jgi:hypothetical protein
LYRIKNFSVQAQQLHLAIIDTNSGADLTLQTNSVIVGQQMNWYARLSITNSYMTNWPLSNFQWTIPGTTFSNYVADSSTGILNTNFLMTSSNVMFCWSDSGLKLVKISATVNGKAITGQAWFNVLRPTAQITTISGTVGLDSTNYDAPVLHYGLPKVGFVGMLFSNIVTFPSEYSGNTNYDLQWVQKCISFRGEVETNDGSGAWYEGLAANVLDTSYPYRYDPLLPYSPPCTDDSPNSQDLSPYTSVSFSEVFEMWLMFKPSGGQWVPLQAVAWSWSGAGYFDGSIWQLTDGSSTLNPTGINITTFPVWTDNLTNHFVFQKE